MALRTTIITTLIVLTSIAAKAQTVVVAGACINGSITLNATTPVNSKPAYTGTGMVASTPGVNVNLYWLSGTDNLWVLDFDGQPYFENNCASPKPPGNNGTTSCLWTTVPATACSGVSALSITGTGGALPIQLVYFTGEKKDTKAAISWQTANEYNNQGFEIQRSSDAGLWNNIGFVKGSGNSSVAKTYEFIDNSPVVGKNYYRLNQLDMDGKSTYSKIINIDFESSRLYVLKNNFSTGTYQLQVLVSNPVELTVHDITGRQLIHQVVSGGLQVIDITRYSPGTYLLQIKAGQSLFIEKLIKQ